MKLFIIHGWTYSLDKWTAICRLLKEAGFEPVLLKVPGLTAPSDKVWDMDGYVQWLDKQLAGEAAPVVIGHSNGGRIALSYAQAHPGRLKHLILIDSAGVVNTRKTRTAKLKTLKLLAKVGKVLTPIPGVKQTFYRVIGGQDYLQAPPNMKQTMQQMFEADNQLEFKRIDVPTTIIWGRDDSYTPLRDGQKMAAMLPDADLHVIDHARHAPFFSHPDEVIDVIQKAAQ